jgi:hypothetical protein
MASQVIAEITRSQLNDAPASQSTITTVEHIASYNWIDKDKPTILVPGKLFRLNPLCRVYLRSMKVLHLADHLH